MEKIHLVKGVGFSDLVKTCTKLQSLGKCFMYVFFIFKIFFLDLKMWFQALIYSLKITISEIFIA